MLRRQIRGTQTAQRYNYAFAGGKLTSALSTQCAHERLLENACTRAHVYVCVCVCRNFAPRPSRKCIITSAGTALRASVAVFFPRRISNMTARKLIRGQMRVLRFRGNKKRLVTKQRHSVTLSEFRLSLTNYAHSAHHS